MSTERLVREALEGSVKDLACPEPDLEQLVAAGRAMRRRRVGVVAGLAAAAVLVLVLAGLSFAWAGRSGRALEPVPANPTATSAPVPSGSSPTATGSRVPGAVPEPVYLANGVLRVGEQPVVDDPPLELFTLLDDGVVYLEDASDRIVWRSWTGETTLIGSHPWAARQQDLTLEDRAIVGNPTGEHVAWMETTAGRRGDLVLVQGNTGKVLARTAVPVAADDWVDILFVDHDSVYLRRCPAAAMTAEERANVAVYGGQGPDNTSGCGLWVWDWTAGSPPRDTGHEWNAGANTGDYVLEVGTETWATESEDGHELVFVTPVGRTLSAVEAQYMDGRPGNHLSPDGRYWYGEIYESFVDTRTGEIRDVSSALDEAGLTGSPVKSGWLTATVLVLQFMDGFTACDAVTLTCTERTDIGPTTGPDPVSVPVQ